MNHEVPENLVGDQNNDSENDSKLNKVENAKSLLLFETKNKCNFIESYLGKENFVIRRISSSLRRLQDSIPNRVRMSITVDDMYQNQVRGLLRDASSITIEAKNLREAISEAEEEQLAPEIIESIEEIYRKLNDFATKTERAIEEISGTIRRIRKWVDEGTNKRILSRRVGDEIHSQARRVNLTLNRFKEECVNPSLIEFRLLMRQIEAYEQSSTDTTK